MSEELKPLTSEELDALDRKVNCLRLEVPKAVADDVLPEVHRLIATARRALPDDGRITVEQVEAELRRRANEAASDASSAEDHETYAYFEGNEVALVSVAEWIAQQRKERG